MNSKMSQNDFRARTKPLQISAVALALLMAAAFAAVGQGTNLFSALDYPSFKIIAERNIFNQSRMPHEHAAQPARIPDSFSLVGTLFYAGGDIAFFDGTSDEYQKALKVGGDIAGFKVTAVTLNSVTLSDGTNQTVLKITTQMRRDDDGHWSVSAEPVSYSSVGNSSGSFVGGSYSSRSRRYDSSRGNSLVMMGGTAGTEQPSASEMEDNSPADAAPSDGANANSALERLMQRRAEQEQQLGQGQ